MIKNIRNVLALVSFSPGTNPLDKELMKCDATYFKSRLLELLSSPMEPTDLLHALKLAILLKANVVGCTFNDIKRSYKDDYSPMVEYWENQDTASIKTRIKEAIASGSIVGVMLLLVVLASKP